MAKLGLVLACLVGGLLIAAGIFALVWIEFHPATTEVWKSSSDIRLANGALIPAGTEMTVDAYMPEGFVSLSLAINVDGEALAGFDKRTENLRNLSIPYWVEQQ